MPIKPNLLIVVFLFICVSVFPQTETDNFINDSFWYWKYLPQENISEYYALKNTLEYFKENDNQTFEKLKLDFSESIRYLNRNVYESLQNESLRINPKIQLLIERYGSNEEVNLLSQQFFEFKNAVAQRIFPYDDSCLSKIDELYSRLITRLGYVSLNDNTYTVKKGDYLRKIAEMFYGNEFLWSPIFNENINNKNFLPNPQNPDLIYPDARIRIPPRPE